MVSFALPASGGARRLGISLLSDANGSIATRIYLERVSSPSQAPMMALNVWGLTINTTSSGSVPGHKNGFPLATKTFTVLPAEKELVLRVVLDRSIVEAFAQGGRG